MHSRLPHTREHTDAHELLWYPRLVMVYTQLFKSLVLDSEAVLLALVSDWTDPGFWIKSVYLYKL